jgi:hypothetical protein
VRQQAGLKSWTVTNLCFNDERKNDELKNDELKNGELKVCD